VRRKAH